MALEAQNSSTQNFSDRNLETMRREYAECASKLPEKDKKACLEWLHGNPESSDPKKLATNLEYLKKSANDQEKHIDAYQKALSERVKKGVVRKETERERLEWFKNLSFVDKAKIVTSRDAKLDDLFDPEREKNLKEFKDLWEHFGNFLPLHKKFMGQEFDDRKKTVAELREKCAVLDSKILPTIVKDELRREGAKIGAAEFKSQIARAEKTHAAQKERFGKLPAAVQEEIKKEFKDELLPGREKMLAEVEAKIADYKNRYAAGISKMTQPNSRGLTFFSPKSAAKYNDWFAKDLSLTEMKNIAQHDPDLANPKRAAFVEKMGWHLEDMPKSGRKAALTEFNNADLEGRETIIAKYEGTGLTGKTAHGDAAEPKKQNLISKLIHKLTFSSGHGNIKKTAETFAIASEMALRRKRYQITQNTKDEKLAQPTESHEQQTEQKNLHQTAERTEKIQESMKSERLHDTEGHAKLKLNVLETETGDRERLKRALKSDVDNTNAKLGGDLKLVRKTGEVVTDAREYERGEVRNELGRVLEAVTPELEKELASEGKTMEEKDIKEAAKKADWDKMAKEIIRRSVV